MNYQKEIIVRIKDSEEIQEALRQGVIEAGDRKKYWPNILFRSGTNWYAYCASNPVCFVDGTGLESYVFYTTGENSDFTEQAEWKKEQLEMQGEDVVMIPVATAEDFVNGWDAMGEKDGESVNINYVEIYTHAKPTILIFLDGSSTEAINISGINKKGEEIAKVSDLSEKVIDELNIYGCNAGNYLNYFYEGNNIAAEFSQKTQGGVVYAYDGNVAFGTPRWKFREEDRGIKTGCNFVCYRCDYIVDEIWRLCMLQRCDWRYIQ